jgi:FdhD protein
MSSGGGEAFVRRVVQLEGAAPAQSWGIAVEAAVELRINGSPWTVMLATPTDLEDLALGLALTEQLVADPSTVSAITVTSWLGDFTVDLAVAGVTPVPRARTMAGNSGCGLCGLESLAAFRAGLPPAHRRDDTDVLMVTDAAIHAAWDALPAHQSVNRETHSVHAAAWCATDGTILLVREDVGRHNALDKLVGALAQSGHLGTPGFIAMTSRCSYELVAKAAVARAQLLATISAPTTLALAWSEVLEVPIACAGPGRRVVRFPSEVLHAGG